MSRLCRLWPSYASAHNNLGTLVQAWGRAEHHFLQALRYNRDHVNAHYNLAKLYRYLRHTNIIRRKCVCVYKCVSPSSDIYRTELAWR